MSKKESKTPHRLAVDTTAGHYRRLQLAAAGSGESVSAWVRRVTEEAAAAELARLGEVGAEALADAEAAA